MLTDNNEQQTNINEYFLSIGLNSNIKESDFKRNNLNLVVVLDISGSMSSQFNNYYYDASGKRKVPNKEDADGKIDNRNKLEIAKDAIIGLLDHLTDKDRFGMILFESQSYIAKPLNFMKYVDKEILSQHIKDIKTMGGTNFESGYISATKLFDDPDINIKSNKHITDDSEIYDNRIIFLTDAMPNTGLINENSLLGLIKKNANLDDSSITSTKNNIYSTFIGIGGDFNSKLVDYITKIRGSNYYSVHNSHEFIKRMEKV